MGLKTGLLIGGILLITVMGTFIFMNIYDWQLHRVSLGALIIALGMLVDNAIVVVEGILIGMQKRLTKVEAASLIVKQTKWPLLAATFIAIIAFAPIGLSPDATGEFAGSLFYVLLISLLLSWITAITLTPFFATLLFKNKKYQDQNSEDDTENSDHEDPYKAGIYVGYKRLLEFALKMPKMTMLLMFFLFIGAGYGFKFVKKSFFPSSNLPMFYLEYRLPSGSDIRATSDTGAELETYASSLDKVQFISSTIGRGATRFMLTYKMEMSYSNYGQLIIRVEDKDSIIPVITNLREFIKLNYPNVESKITRVNIGPSSAAKIEARISGSDPAILRQLSDQTKQVLAADKGAMNITDDWKNMTKVIRPVFNAKAAREVGISKSDVDNLLLTNYRGKTVGVYRDGTERLPILIRLPDNERQTINTLEDMRIYSPVLRSRITSIRAYYSSGFRVQT